MTFGTVLVSLATLFLCVVGFAENTEAKSKRGERITIAKKGKSKSEGRKKVLRSEKTIKYKKGARKTSVDFDAVDISGQRKNPLGSMIGTAKDKRGFNFIEVRREWHNEMVQSASNLD